MSSAGYAWAWERKPEQASSLLVLLYLVERAGADGLCWPSQARIARDTTLSERTVYSALADLETRKLITRTKRVMRRGRVSDLIRIQFSSVTVFPGGPIDEMSEPAPTDAEILEKHGRTWERPEYADDLPANAAPTEPPGRKRPATDAETPTATVAAESPIGESPKQAAGARGDATQGAPRREISLVTREQVEMADLGVMAASIFDAATDRARNRVKDDPRKIMFALRDAAAKGHDLAVVVPAMIAFVRSDDQTRDGGRYACSPARAIDEERWRFVDGRTPKGSTSKEGRALPDGHPAAEEPPCILDEPIIFEDETYLAPEGGQRHIIGTWEKPGVQRQLSIMEQWSPRLMSTWNGHKWGPPPGHPDCRIWPDVLRRFTYEGSGGEKLGAEIGAHA